MRLRDRIINIFLWIPTWFAIAILGLILLVVQGGRARARAYAKLGFPEMTTWEAMNAPDVILQEPPK